MAEDVNTCVGPNFYKRFEIRGKVAVVTGASDGIGRDLAIGLARAGCQLILCSRREGKLLELKQLLAREGQTAEIFPIDIRRTEEIDGLKAFAQQMFGRVDILVNNAGFAATKPAWEVSEDDWDAIVDTGLKGAFFCCQALGSIMRQQGYGKIINIGSTFSRTTVPGRAVYAAVKAGIDHLTEALAVEWAAHGIRVNCVAPTAVNTPSRQDLLQGPVLEKVLSRIPLGRLATPDDLLGAVIYLCSEASDFVTGQTLFVDGGWVAAS